MYFYWLMDSNRIFTSLVLDRFINQLSIFNLKKYFWLSHFNVLELWKVSIFISFPKQHISHISSLLVNCRFCQSSSRTYVTRLDLMNGTKGTICLYFAPVVEPPTTWTKSVWALELIPAQTITESLSAILHWANNSPCILQITSTLNKTWTHPRTKRYPNLRNSSFRVLL